MIKIVLDTHILIWIVEGDSNISKKMLDFLDDTSIQSRLFVSAISLWEISMLEKKQRIHLSCPARMWVEKALSHPSLALLPISPDIAYESCNLPGNFHGDPADRIIVASARCESMYLFTHDTAIKKYASEGYVEIFNDRLLDNIRP